MKARFLALLVLLFSARASWGAVTVIYPTSWDVGQVFAVSIVSNRPFENPTVTWLGRKVMLDAEPIKGGTVSYALLGSFVRDVKPGDYPLEFGFHQDGKSFAAKENVRLRPRKYPEENLKVSPKMVFPDKKDLPRIKEEAALAAEAKKTMSAKRLWTTPPERPVPGVVTSRYGFRRLYNGVPKGCHAGTDFRAAVGIPVKAPFAGRVILTGDHYYAGKSVYVDSGNGVISMFFHLSEILVKEGQSVKKGQIVAKSGATGRITGPHLHYGLCLSGQYSDAAPFFGKSVTGLLKGLPRKKVRP